MASLFPREEHAEALFHRILSNPGAEQQLYETFCMEQENASFEDGGGAECSFAKALLQAYENRDISALTIALCNNTMFDLLRTAYLIPYRFHGKNGGNPRLLTDANGEVREEYRNAVSARELRKFHDIYRQHLSVPRAALYLADGSHLRHKYTKDMQVREMYSPSRRGVLTLYALPDTVEQGLTEAQAYNIVWDAFNEIQQRCPTAMVFYGQDTGYKLQKSHDELGVLLQLVHRVAAAVAHTGLQAAHQLVDGVAGQSLVRHAALHALGDQLLVALLEVAVLGAVVHGGQGAHAAVGLELAALVESRCRRGTPHSRPAGSRSSPRCAGGNGLDDVAGELHAAVGDDGHAVLGGHTGRVIDGGHLGHADAGHHAGGADGAGADAHLDTVGARLDQGAGPLGVATLPAISCTSG